MNDGFSSVAEIFLRATALYPKRPALVVAGQTWSYEYLGCLIAAASSRLKEIIPAPAAESRIAIIGGNHPAYIAAYWSAQFIGGATVEIDRNESLQSLFGAVSATRPRFVITDRDDLKHTLQGKVPVESFGEFLTECEKGRVYGKPACKLPLERQFTKRSTQRFRECSIIYTSGTTATAKGVVLSHGNFCFIARAVADYLGLNETDRCALVLPLCHTYGKSVLLSAAVAGAAVVLLDGFGNHKRLLSQLTSDGCTVLSAVPYHIHALVKSGCLSRYDFSSLRIITSSADKLSPCAIDCLAEALPEVRIFSMYGLTESTTRACYLPPEMIHAKKESCGRPLPGVELKIIMKDGRTAAAGETGEVLLRGPNVMTGYLDDPDLTAAAVVDGWLKTGDIGHLDIDGFLYIDGRKRDIIKCAGERISPLEIEGILMEYPGVEQAAVIGRPDSLMGEIIHAYVASRDSSLKKTALREYCRARLSHNKVPYKYTIVERLPGTNTGKVQKHALKEGLHEFTTHG